MNCTNIFERYPPSKEDTSKTIMMAKDRMCMVDSGASLHLMGENSLNAQERTHVRKTIDDLKFQSANGIVHSTKEGKVHIQELGTYLYVKVVEDSPPAMSWERFCDELGFSYSWQPGENHILPKGERPSHSALNTLFLPSLTHRAKSHSIIGYNSNPTRLRKAKPSWENITSFGCNRCGRKHLR